jgi:long-chain acyl-CoA synthetase
LVAQVFVYGESIRSTLVGIVVPDNETLAVWAKNQGIQGSFKDLCQNETVKKTIMEQMVAVGKKFKLHSFEQIKGIHLECEQFTPENGLVSRRSSFVF